MRGKQSITWPLVALVTVCGAFLWAVLWLIPKDDTQSRTAVIGMLVTAVGVIVAYFTRARADDLKGDTSRIKVQVNGRLSSMLSRNAELTRQNATLRAENMRYRVWLGIDEGTDEDHQQG